MSVAVIGDVMLDEFVYGDVHRISPESAAPVLSIKRTEQNPGGAANVARGVAALDCKVELVSVIGQDRAGNDLIKALGDIGPNRLTPWLTVDKSRPTTIKTRYVSDQHHTHILRVDRETTEPVTGETMRALTKLAHAAIADASVVVLSDYCKGVFTPTFAQMLVRGARLNKKYVIVDTKGDVSKFAGANCIKLNLCELGFCFDEPDEDVIAAAACRLAAEHKFDRVIVTRGEGGLSAYSDHDDDLRCPGKRVRVRDVSGAGDTVVAALAKFISWDIPFQVALDRANTAASIAVSKPGTAVVTLAELQGGTRVAPSDNWSLLDQRLVEWRGQRIGFANGCFDMLHPGHVHLLTEARQHCDKLIVGLNSDASVFILKGHDRPVQDVTARADMLAALDVVDLVVVFNALDPTTLIKHIRPHVIFKGDDYVAAEVRGREYADNVHIIPQIRNGLSTTDTINKIRESAK